MLGRQKLIRCMAYPEGDLFVAVCLDWSLAAQANTLEEAISKLDAQITDYIAEIQADPQYAYALLNRSAPLSLWIKYFWLRFLAMKNRTSRVAFFEELRYT